MYYLIVYSSITFAKRIQNHFKYDGDYLSVIQTPSELSQRGCSYSIKIKPRKLREVIDASGGCGFKIKGIFKQDGDVYTEVNCDEIP